MIAADALMVAGFPIGKPPRQPFRFIDSGHLQQAALHGSDLFDIVLPSVPERITAALLADRRAARR